MKNELELKHIATYLPYNLRAIDYFQGHKLIRDVYTSNLMVFVDGDTNAKILLRPLSDLTKEITHNGKTFIPLDWLRRKINENLQFSKMGFNDYEVKGLVNKLHYSLFDIYECEIELSEIIKLTQKLYEWHFDIHGLIEKGLAINLNTI